MGKRGNKGGENGQKGGQKGNGRRGRDWFIKIIIQMLTDMLITMMIIIEGRNLAGGNDMITAASSTVT